MATLYGMNAVTCTAPNGSTGEYLIADATPTDREAAAWTLTKADGSTHRVSIFPSGRWRCSCKAFRFRGRWDVWAVGCKHIFSCRNMLAERGAKR